MKSKKIKINGLKHQFYLWGNPKNPPLVLLHGWLDTGASFQFIAESLQKRFYCVAPDLRGYGKSEHSQNPLGYFFFEYVADVHRILEHFSPKRKVDLLGHSLGGFIASVYAGTFPERVKRLVNVEGFAFQRRNPRTPPQRVREWIEKLETNRFRIYPDSKALALRLMKSNPALPEARAAFVARYLGKKAGKGFQIAADPKHKLIEPYSISPEARYNFWESVEAPCLFVAAGQDPTQKGFLKDYQRELEDQKRHFPKSCRLEIFPSAGHMIHHEKPEELAALVLSFLKKEKI